MNTIKEISPIAIPGLLKKSKVSDDERVGQAIEKVIGVSYSLLKSKTKKRIVAESRFIFLNVMNKIIRVGTEKSGNFVGLDHCATCFANKRVKVLSEIDADFRNNLKKVIEIVESDRFAFKSNDIETVGSSNDKRI